jgi:hypothetical protein
MLRRISTQAGQTATEYLGLLLLVATVVFLLATTEAALKIPNRVSELVCQIAGGECAPQANAPRRLRPAATFVQHRARQQGDDICRYMRSLCELSEPPDVGVDLGDEELYDVTFGRGVYVSIYENATGAILLIYELCDEDIECLVSELEERGIGPQEGTGAAQWNDALDEDQWEDLEEAIRDVRENGGCLNAHFRSGVNWSTRDGDDDTCRRGATISHGEEGVWQADLGVDGARFTLGVSPSERLTAGLAELCPPGSAAACLDVALSDPAVLEAFPELEPLQEELERSQAISNMLDRALAEDEHADLEAVLSQVAGQGGCLAVDVAADGAIDWDRSAPGEPGC